MREQWDQEWGRIDQEGNLWWLGSYRANWVSVMGKSKWGWFCKHFDPCFVIVDMPLS